MTPVFDVVVVSYNTRDLLLACLRSLHAASPAGLAEVHVVDNASTDGSADAVATEFPDVRLVRLDQNLGFGAANNVALRRASAPLVLLLNSDTTVGAGAIEALVARHLARGATASGPRLVDAAGRVEVSFGPMLSPAGEARQWLWQRLARSDARWARRAVERRAAAERWTDWVSGACLLADRAAVAQAGFFDERYFLYEEDVDLCAAIRALGGRILFTPAATVTHLRGRSAASAGARAHYDRAHLAFYEKHAPRWAPWLRAWLRVRGRAVR
jgi:GT2 family glycosyltransferase